MTRYRRSDGNDVRHALETDALYYEYVYIRLKFVMPASKNIYLYCQHIAILLISAYAVSW